MLLQVSFSAAVSTIPGRISSVSSSEELEMDDREFEFTRSVSSPGKVEGTDEEETEESESSSPSPSPSHLQTSPRKGPLPAPKPSSG